MNHKLSLALAAALFALPLSAMAQEEATEEAAAEEVAVEEGDEAESAFSWNLALTSDYVFRGVSQSNEDPALQGGLDYSFDNGIYAGFWGSNVDFNDPDGPDLEIDTYIGWNTDLSDEWNLDLMLTRYNYMGERDAYGDIEYNEFVGALTYSEMVTFTLGYTNDVYGSGETGMYYGLAGSWDVGNDFTFDAGVGLSTFDNSTGIEDYADWTLGISHPLGPFGASLNYYGTSSDGEFNFGEIAEDRLVLTISLEG